VCADIAAHCLLLARTDPESSRSRGITYFIMDMSAPGLTVRPIKQNTGHAEFCEIFLDEVFIPSRDLVGEVNDGWAVAQRTLTAERGPAGFDVIARLGIALEQFAGSADQFAGAGVRDELERITARYYCVRSLALDLVDALEAGTDVSALTPALKIAQSELLQEATSFATLHSGEDGLVDHRQPHPRGYVSGDWFIDWLGSWAWTIAGGTNEIQRTMIAEKVLRLPAEPRKAMTPVASS
jgi:alkylation response protein AidB-like acyl-CoA dehydrogenase